MAPRKKTRLSLICNIPEDSETLVQSVDDAADVLVRISKDLLDTYLKSAFKFAKKYNFNTNIKSDELFYCNLSDKIGITFTTIPYNSNNIGNGQYVVIGRAGNSSCIMYMILDTSISNTNDQMLMVDYNVQSNKFGLSTSNFRNQNCY